MNDLEQLALAYARLETRVTRLEIKQSVSAPTTTKPRCDAQGRLLEAPSSGILYSTQRGYVQAESYWHGAKDSSSFITTLSLGLYFISQPAAEAELTRLKCLQRLRGMEPDYGRYASVIYGQDNVGVTLPFKELGDLTPEERAAFLYREPMGK
jgi:hypothetical protein